MRRLHSPAGRAFALVGMPGAGKSEVGRRLAERLGLPFADGDLETERETGRPIAEIFRSGEAGFREVERRALARLANGRPCVVATGGGAFADSASRALLRERFLTVWLDAPPELLAARIGNGEERPLLAGGDPLGRLRALAEERRRFYAQAELRIDSSPPVEEVVDAVLAALEERAE